MFFGMFFVCFWDVCGGKIGLDGEQNSQACFFIAAALSLSLT